MQTVELKQYPEIARVIKAADPSYKKRKAFVSVVDFVTLTGTYWDGGSRDTYTAVDLASYQRITAPQYDPPQFGGPAKPLTVDLPNNVAIVRTGVFCGKTATAHVYVKPLNVAKLFTYDLTS